MDVRGGDEAQPVAAELDEGGVVGGFGADGR